MKTTDGNLTERTDENAGATAALRSTEFTPGPWECVFIHGNNHYRLYYAYGALDGEPLTEKNGDANARLIAAAPDLLKALEGMMRSVQDRLHSDTCRCAGCTNARAAIKKAKS